MPISKMVPLSQKKKNLTVTSRIPFPSDFWGPTTGAKEEFACCLCENILSRDVQMHKTDKTE